MTEEFYWRNARDSLITKRALQLFQILAKHDGEEFDAVKESIDREYLSVTGDSEIARHGGKIQTAKEVYREAGWVDLSPNSAGQSVIKITDAGRQALLLLTQLPDFLKAVPYFVVELLARYQLNNPARPPSRDADYDAQLAGSNVFPYWTLFRLLRDCDNYLTADELRRFVFQLKRSEDIPHASAQIREFRKDKERALSEEELNKKYGGPLTGAVADTKYIMGRLGTQVGKLPPVVVKEGLDTWRLEEAYVPFIDEILKNAPVFKEHLTEDSWMKEYGRPVELERDVYPEEEEEETDDFPEEELDKLADDDPVWKQTKALLDSGSLTIILAGCPGTSKTWYAWRLALKIAGDKRANVRRIQFHPSYSYDDFIEGYVPVAPKAGQSSAPFRVVPKVFLSLCSDARKRLDETFVLVIDELTRGDISRIFGEFLTYLEPDYRNRTFVLTYSERTISIPKNLVVVGTMNPFDRSITELDDAFERRFDRVALTPDVRIVRLLLQKAGAQGPIIEKAIHFFNEANKLTPHGFGHTYFLGIDSEVALVRLWNHKLKFVFDKIFRFDGDKFQEIKKLYAAQLTDASGLL